MDKQLKQSAVFIFVFEDSAPVHRVLIHSSINSVKVKNFYDWDKHGLMKLCLGTLWGYSRNLKVSPAKQGINYFYYKSIHESHKDQIVIISP